MARRNDSLRCTTRLRSTSVKRMSSGRPMPRRRTSSTSSLRSMAWPLPSAWTVTLPLSLMQKYPAPQLRTPYFSKASARDAAVKWASGRQNLRSAPIAPWASRRSAHNKEKGPTVNNGPLPLQLRQGLAHLLHVSVHLHPGPHPSHRSRAVDEKRGAGDALELPPVEGLVPPGAVILRHRVVLVGQQGEGELVLPGEPGVAGGVVGAHAQDHRSGLHQLRVLVAEGAGLAGAPRGVVLRIEVENHRLPLVVRELHRFAGLVGQGERGGLLSDLGHRHRTLLHGGAERLTHPN